MTQAEQTSWLWCRSSGKTWWLRRHFWLPASSCAWYLHTTQRGNLKSDSTAARSDQTAPASHRCCGPGAGRPSWRPPCRASSREAVTLSLLLSPRLELLPPRLCALHFQWRSGWGAGIGQGALLRFRKDCRSMTVKKGLELRNPTGSEIMIQTKSDKKRTLKQTLE